MKFISTRTHGLLDFAVPAALMMAPKLFGFEDNEKAARVPRMMAATHVAYSLFTDYERGLVRKLPMKGHLAIDAGSAVLLAASPWLLGFASSVTAPHVVSGLMELGIAMTTETEPKG
ncbi:MAG: hypothetical protein M3198_00230 [Actinomycetota bacterium]|nr:hypothetical protein [Actinomycetota bacterium]